MHWGIGCGRGIPFHRPREHGPLTYYSSDGVNRYLRYGVEKDHKFTNGLIGLMVCPVMSGRYKDGGTRIRRDSSWR
jgi:hypothetical protein